MPAMPSRFRFASFSTYRKGSPTYRRAFSAYVNSLYMRHADNARVSSAQPARGRCSRKFCTAGTRTMLAGECPLCGAERLEDGAPATHVRYAVNVRLLCGYVEIVTHAVLRRYTSPAPRDRLRRQGSAPLRFSATTDPADADSVPQPPPPGLGHAHDPAPVPRHHP